MSHTTSDVPYHESNAPYHVSHTQVIAGIYYNTAMMLELLEKTHFPDSPEAITSQFFTQWVKDATADLYMG